MPKKPPLRPPPIAPYFDPDDPYDQPYSVDPLDEMEEMLSDLDLDDDPGVIGDEDLEEFDEGTTESERMMKELVDELFERLKAQNPGMTDDQIWEIFPWTQDRNGNWVPDQSGGGAGGGIGGGGPSGGGGGIARDRYGNRVFPDGTVQGRNGEGRPGYGEAVPQPPQPPSGNQPPPGSGEDPGAPPDGQGGGLTDPKFPDGAGGGGDNFPVISPGGTLPLPIPPVINTTTGTTDPGDLGGPSGDASDIFSDLLDSFDDKNTEANQANEDRYNDILQGYADQLTGANKTLDETAEGLGNAEGILSGRWNRVGSALEEGEGNLEKRFGETQGRLSLSEERLQEILAGLGDQERKDINRRWDIQTGNQEQGLIDRGLGNTTLRGNMLSGIEERRSGDLNRLRDSLAREQVGQGNQAINRQLGLDTLGLGQSENSINRRSQYGLQGQQFGENTIERMLEQDRLRLATQANLSTNKLGFQERRDDTGPDLGQLARLAFQFGQFGSGDFGPRNLGNQYTTQPIPIQGQSPQRNPRLPFVS